MGKQRFMVARMTDEQLAAGLAKVSEALGPLKVAFQAFDASLGNVRFPDQDLDEWRRLLALKASVIGHLSFAVIPGVHCYYWRGGNNDPKSPYLDEVQIAIDAPDISKVEAAAKLTECFTEVRAPSPSESIGLLEEQRAIQEATFSRLQLLQESAVRDSIDLRRQLDEQFAAKAVELESSYAEKSRLAEEALVAKSAALQEREAELEERRQRLDDRDNTTVRREIRQSLLADVKDRVANFGVSKGTEAKRRPVAHGIIVLFVFLAALATLEGIGLSARPATLGSGSAAASAASGATQSGLGIASLAFEPSDRWAHWIRLTLLTFFAAAVLLYYIRWQDKWAERHSKTELALRQFHLDVNRANWVIESCLEWRKETESAIPTILLESVTRGLFTTPEERSEPEINPADELAKAILGSSSKVRLKAGDSEVEIDKPGKKVPSEVKN